MKIENNIKLPAIDSLVAYINRTPPLISLLYDLDLMPEQVDIGSKDWLRMLQLSLWHRSNSQGKPIHVQP